VVSRVAHALAPTEARVLVLTGPELDPGEIDVPQGVAVRRYVPHRVLLPEAALVVAHGGTGTLLAALSAGVPVLSVPLGRDQPANAHRLEQLGLGRSLDRDAAAGDIADTVGDMLSSEPLRARVRAFAAAVAAYGAGARAAEAIEALARRAR
jgi:MGT family glycosyltransferase